jgi:hypothetical protein
MPMQDYSKYSTQVLYQRKYAYRYACMEYTCTAHGIRLYSAWNTPVPHMEYARNMHEMCIFSCCSMATGTISYVSILLEMEHLKHACFMHVSAHFMWLKPENFMHKISSNNIE